MTLSRPGFNPAPPPKTKNKGWTVNAVRNNVKFLESVNTQKLSGYGYAFTLTIKDCPLTPQRWHKSLDIYLKRLRRLDLICYHWVTEWQARGVPHLHMSAFFSTEKTPAQLLELKRAWLEVSKDYRPKQQAQTVKPIATAKGWLEYTAKHGMRGMYHYQRSISGIPEQWRQNTGAVWGKGGLWPLLAAKSATDEATFFTLRRIAKRHNLSQAQKIPLSKCCSHTLHMIKSPTTHPDTKAALMYALTGARRRSQRYHKRSLKCNDYDYSRLKPIKSNISAPEQFRLMVFLGAEHFPEVQPLTMPKPVTPSDYLDQIPIS
jgi:hypothetical protein